MTIVMRICTLRGWHSAAVPRAAIDKKIRDTRGIRVPAPQPQKTTERPRKKPRKNYHAFRSMDSNDDLFGILDPHIS